MTQPAEKDAPARRLCRFCKFTDPACERCTGDRKCSCHELTDGHGLLAPRVIPPEKP